MYCIFFGVCYEKYLIKLADHLDEKGFRKEADYEDWIIKKSTMRAQKDMRMEEVCPPIQFRFGLLYGESMIHLKDMRSKTDKIILVELTPHLRKTQGKGIVEFYNLNEINKYLNELKSNGAKLYGNPRDCSDQETYIDVAFYADSPEGARAKKLLIIQKNKIK